MKRGMWTSHEDKLLSDYVMCNGIANWRTLPAKAGLNRCGKSCRLRWLNYLRPDIKRGSITKDEEDLILRLHNLLGNRWSLIAGRLPGRTDNEIKNYWNTCLRKKAATSPCQAKLERESSQKTDEMTKSKDPCINNNTLIRPQAHFADQISSSYQNYDFAFKTTIQSSPFDPFLDYFGDVPGFELNDDDNYGTIYFDENSGLMTNSTGEIEESMTIYPLLQNDAGEFESFSF